MEAGRLGVALFLLAAAGCTPATSRLEPYRSDPEAARALAEQAETFCRERRGVTPPHPFTTDGCSAFPDRDWVHCCVAHDMAYWCGGSAEERAEADRTLRDCVGETRSESLGAMMRAGTWAGGPPWVPAGWRWGYGWGWPAGYADEEAED